MNENKPYVEKLFEEYMDCKQKYIASLVKDSLNKEITKVIENSDIYSKDELISLVSNAIKSEDNSNLSIMTKSSFNLKQKIREAKHKLDYTISEIFTLSSKYTNSDWIEIMNKAYSEKYGASFVTEVEFIQKKSLPFFLVNVIAKQVKGEAHKTLFTFYISDAERAKSIPTAEYNQLISNLDQCYYPSYNSFLINKSSLCLGYSDLGFVYIENPFDRVENVKIASEYLTSQIIKRDEQELGSL